MSEMQRLRIRLGGLETPMMNGDNISILLASFFENDEQDIVDDNGWSIDAIKGATEVLDAVHAHYVDACASVQRERDAWKGALIDELIVAHIYKKEHEYDPKRALADAITWNVRVAMDPAASSDAAALIDRGRQEVLRDAVELARFAWDNYPNPDINHVDYRVEVARKAESFLARYEASK